MDNLGNFIIKSVDFMFESGILITIYVFFAVGYIFYKLRDKFFHPYQTVDKKSLFYIYTFLLLEMLLVAIIERFSFAVFQFLLMTLFSLSTISIAIVFEKYRDNIIFEKYLWKIITAGIIQMGIFMTAANVNNINIFIKFFANIVTVLMPTLGILKINESKKNKDD